MQRIYNLDKWQRLPEGSRLEFSNTMPRTVRIEVNTPDKSALYVTDHATGEVFFLALVEGRDTIEYSAPGAFSLMAEGPDCMIYTADGADVSMKLDAPETFTRIVERRKRNPELEHIVATMSRNLERRLEQQSRELAHRLERGQAAKPHVPATAGVPQGAGAAPGQTHGAGSSSPQAAAPSGGREGGATGAAASGDPGT